MLLNIHPLCSGWSFDPMSSSVFIAKTVNETFELKSFDSKNFFSVQGQFISSVLYVSVSVTINFLECIGGLGFGIFVYMYILIDFVHFFFCILMCTENFCINDEL